MVGMDGVSVVRADKERAGYCPVEIGAGKAERFIYRFERSFQKVGIGTLGTSRTYFLVVGKECDGYALSFAVE